MEKNTPGQAPAGAPVFLAQGAADTTVRPEITKQFGEVLCKQGTRVDYIVLPGVTHTFAAKDSVGQALAWITDRFRVPHRAVRHRQIEPGRQGADRHGALFLVWAL